MKKFIFAVVLTATLSLVASDVSAQYNPDRVGMKWSQLSTRGKCYVVTGLTGGYFAMMYVDWALGWYLFKQEMFGEVIRYDRNGYPKMSADDIDVQIFVMTAREDGVDLDEWVATHQ